MELLYWRESGEDDGLGLLVQLAGTKVDNFSNHFLGKRDKI